MFTVYIIKNVLSFLVPNTASMIKGKKIVPWSPGFKKREKGVDF
jgi:hypothetical protein